MKDWGRGLCKALNKKLVELTGDVTPDLRALLAADVIVATPEKWDGMRVATCSRLPCSFWTRSICLALIGESHATLFSARSR